MRLFGDVRVLGHAIVRAGVVFFSIIWLAMVASWFFSVVGRIPWQVGLVNACLVFGVLFCLYFAGCTWRAKWLLSNDPDFAAEFEAADPRKRGFMIGSALSDTKH